MESATMTRSTGGGMPPMMTMTGTGGSGSNLPRPTRIFNYPWHIAHQFELFRLDNTKWSWLTQHRRSYSPFPRGDYFKELGAEWVPHYESGKYDFALLHLDQQCFEPSLWERGKGSLFRDVDSVVRDIPKVAIMHGTPYYPESFESDITEENYKMRGFTKEQVGMSSKLIELFHAAIKDIDVIVFNSHTARAQWGCNFDVMNREGGKLLRSYAFWHGMNENEWYDLPKEPRVVTMISPAGLDMYYDRVLLRAVRDVLAERNIEHCHITVDAQFKSWDEYRNFLGRSLVYFNPTRESPMPRSRTEALLSGCCVVTTPGQDVEQFITSGENGIIINRNPQQIADVIESLIYDYKKAIEIGKKGREMAKQRFSPDAFNANWQQVISYVKTLKV